MSVSGIPDLCYCGSALRIVPRTEGPNIGRLFYECENEVPVGIHLTKWWDVAVVEEIRAMKNRTEDRDDPMTLPARVKAQEQDIFKLLVAEEETKEAFAAQNYSIGRYLMDIVFDEEVLEETSLTTFYQQPDLTNKHHKYRHFFARCVKASNPTACYLESLRTTSRDGLMAEGIYLLKNIKPVSLEMALQVVWALSILLIASGHYYEAMDVYEAFKNKVGSYKRAKSIAALFLQSIREIGPVPISEPWYRGSWRYRKTPFCEFYANGEADVGFKCTDEAGCIECLSYWRSIDFLCMF